MPISDCEVRDPRIRRTRQLLQGALSALMQSTSFDEISVHDITEAATVNRATFYDHYTDKFALLEAMVAGGFHRLLEQRNVTFDGTCRKAVGNVVLAVCDYLEQAHATGNCKVQSAFRPLMDAAVARAVKNILIQGMPAESASEIPVEVIATTASWALCGAVNQWLTTPARPPGEEMVEPVLELVWPMFELAGSEGHQTTTQNANGVEATASTPP